MKDGRLRRSLCAEKGLGCKISIESGREATGGTERSTPTKKNGHRGNGRDAHKGNQYREASQKKLGGSTYSYGVW